MGRDLDKSTFLLAKRMGKAIAQYNMIQANDRILVAVSGGKDSLTLLTLLQERKKWVPITYTLIPVHVRTKYSYASEEIERFFDERGYDYHIVHMEIKHTSSKPACFWCSWNRRKQFFALATKLNCNKLALGHHKDDIIETMLLNIFFQSQISTMLPKVSLFSGKLDIIRPLALVEEKDIDVYAKKTKLPVQSCNCPHKDLSKRKNMKNMIEYISQGSSRIKDNVFNSTKRIDEEYLILK